MHFLEESTLMSAPAEHTTPLIRTALYDLHIKHGAKMVPFAGYELPIQYQEGIVAEHLHTRNSASLFDVSHMGTVKAKGPGIVNSLEKIIPSDLQNLDIGKMSYSALLNQEGGIIDDLMITKMADDDFTLVINGACKEKDLTFLHKNLPEGSLTLYENAALIALQGPKAADTLSALIPDANQLYFLEAMTRQWEGHELVVSRAGYTGEDGFEILISNETASNFVEKILENEDVKFAGLGARDSLRLEAGLCLYGQDLDEMITPIEAGLRWIIPKKRRDEGNFNGASVILKQLNEGTHIKRVGLLPENKVMVRSGTEICLENGDKVGTVTSGSFTPITDRPIAMGYVDHRVEPDTPLFANVRNSLRPCHQAKLPFSTPNYVKR